MGLLDQIIRSAVGSATTPATRGGSSPIVMALLALLASKVMAGRTTVDSAPGGSVGGLGGLIESFQRGGFENVIQSWIGTGPNNAISPDQLHQALGAGTVEDLAQETGLPKQDLLTQLSQLLPGVIDKLTPHGNLPSDADLLAGPRDSKEL
jgi:uncharacterized protein YidB (DUF937 family)